MRSSLLLSLALTAAPALASLILNGLIDKDTVETPLRFSDFDWAQIPPTTDLAYHDCYQIYKCARLDVPLDWNNASDPRRVAVAIMKLPAVVADDDPAFSGSVFTNPGGPGHSGVVFIPRIAHELQRILDKPGRKHYEIVSFDPRGLGYTTPLADCFGGNSFARDEFAVEVRGTAGLSGGLTSLLYNAALHGANGKRCTAADLKKESIFEYIGTPFVVRDMVEMLDKMEELRHREQEAEGRNWSELKKRSFSWWSGKDQDSDEEEDDVARLQFIGYSYGTLLGNYFASMYPGRVHRMILDSVCDADDYAQGPGWKVNIEDLDAVFEQFLKGCHEAGPQTCVLARDADTSWTDVEDRVWNFIDALDEEPYSILDANGYGVIVRGRDFRDFSGISLYSPVHTFKFLANLFNEGVKGNIEVLTDTLPLVPDFATECPLSCDGRGDEKNGTMTEPVEADAMEGVLCIDGEDVSGKNMLYWQSYVDSLVNTSKVWGDRWAEVRFPCSRWPFTTKFRFDGPFTTPPPISSSSSSTLSKKDRPSAPLLFFNNRLDPVTPLRAARRMSSMHPDSTVVVKESMGHGAVLIGPKSPCLEKIASTYFDEGTLPEDGTTCAADCGPWDEGCEPYAVAESPVFAREYLEPTLLQRKRVPLGV